MNKTKLKSYAPQARKDFIAAVTARANLLGLSESGGKLEVAFGERKGDLAIIAGREWPVKVYEQREDLIKRMLTEGFSQTVDAVAYTWFNRFAALRYMEIHDYLDHGHRVLSNREGGMPEILNQATNLDLPHFNKEQAIELKLAGNKDNELYKLILVAQCNALSSAMPFLFERIDDETELLLPDNLLLTDSVIAKLVSQIPEEDWQEVEIIGWLYQFYISDKKDEVIGKVVKSEDIPAATQLFTPNWIVQYLVQNSVGRLWMMANPSSTLKSQWPYYIEPAEQTPEVNTQLDALIQTRMDEDGGSLNPETIKVLDPACGSGHILVVAYDVLKAIYLERGYQPRVIPRLILEKNLYGIDIDDRAAQMAGFALLMIARADDRRILQEPPKLNVISLQESKGLNVDELATHLASFKVNRATIASLVDTFEHAKTFGSLIQIPDTLKPELTVLQDALVLAEQRGDMYVAAAANDLLPLVQQAQVLAMQFDAVVANPPYMGSNGMNAELKNYAKATFPDSKSDLFTMFIERGFSWCKRSGFNSMVTMQSWMFLSSYEVMREKLLANRTINTMAHLGARAFSEISGEVVQTTAFVLQGQNIRGFKPVFFRLTDGNEEHKRLSLLSGQYRFEATVQDEFKQVPGSPLAYWLSWSRVFLHKKIGDSYISGGRNKTHDNEKFVRLWWEVSYENKSWQLYANGGDFRKYYGNELHVVKWTDEARDFYNSHGGLCNNKFWDRVGVTWSLITSALPTFRIKSKSAIYSSGSPTLFHESGSNSDLALIAFLNSPISIALLKVLNPTLNTTVGDVSNLPFKEITQLSEIEANTSFLINQSKEDWDANEQSRDFSGLNLGSEQFSIEKWWGEYFNYCCMSIRDAKIKEERNNQCFIDAYSLAEELSSFVSEDHISLTRADREKDSQRLISYAIGCMMGRYSLDEPGLIYANAGNVGFDPSRYNTFAADTDGIVPITDTLWFEDDAAKRIREFLFAVWDANTLDENMAWLAESLGSKGSETSDEAIRRYLTASFFKIHLQTYKKRPIYWLFSSGKQGAFQALVYLHRYNEGTLARMRSEYVVPLTGKMLSRIEMLEKDATSVSSPAARTKINKEIEVLRKQHIELLAYDEKLRHYADMRIQLDLDDGVKVNYGKFGDLLAEVKAVTGGVEDE
jgi:type II restriction/modification system DNA methylase subunit YeeA